ncbi:hypothetical protein EPUS_03376 [Endocarpon pusillum Z07020]|uniref:Uncharacterized protein n=1 Tax=Endocarpon pusillum (strain Z07020 / HMAS-L-300199) TaxID=1263415 RepID=U1GQF4_ENDPU|nr:uncharacterized protein EPUS_03376 [Endocarpon pusillum Z07020]ERF74186.1 hypothetical protein EPUS_03376 [Endocarpon pusillum Z07020]
MEKLYPLPRTGISFLEILKDPFSQKIFGYEAALEDRLLFTTGFAARLAFLIRNPANHLSLLKLGYTSLEAFLQSNVTGPPLDFEPKDVVFPQNYQSSVADLRKQMFASLSVEGEAVYPLIPDIELFWVGKTIVSNDELCEGFNGHRARMRINFWHQKLLSGPSDSLRDQIYNDAEVLEGQLRSRLMFHGASAEYHFVEFLVEKAVIDIYYGNDVKARTHLAKAAKLRGFDFALTGALGKRTKFQDRDISQLVVLAKSRAEEVEESSPRKGSRKDPPTPSAPADIAQPSPRQGSSETIPASQVNDQRRPGSPIVPSFKKPENIPLDDDTLLESIHFVPPKLLPEVISDNTSLLPSLAELDPAAQPLLSPFDSIILLQIASSISNTSPSDGLTREETLPYATRVLEGGSSNWQVYTQALLVRSRIEGYRSRTAERGLLQLQALVDQVIVETKATKSSNSAVGEAGLDEPGTQSPLPTLQERPQFRSQSSSTSEPTSFLPAARPSETASVAERLKYIYQLHPPLRWELEAELAARWVSMGGLKTALEIYERLQMHAEVALCLAATNNEAKAIQVIRKLLFQPTSEEEGDDQNFTGAERDILPPDAPRLFCILGDLENSPHHYERAWTVSKGRYSRAQRSLGRYHVRKKNYPAAAEAYAKSLEVSRLNASTWFALGCVQLELEDFQGAVESFTRTVQLEADDAEAWSNLAAALLRLPEAEAEAEAEAKTEETQKEDATLPSSASDTTTNKDEPTSPAQTLSTKDTGRAPHPNKFRHDALHALRRAATLKHSSPRIWDNYLTVAASIPPPATPWNEIILAQKRLIELRGKTIGERAVDEKILSALVSSTRMTPRLCRCRGQKGSKTTPPPPH